jgi:hypothetical protein
MELKSVKVKCSFCGREIECPEHMLKDVERHMCFECFKGSSHKLADISEEEFRKIHIDIPKDKMDEVMPDFLLNSILGDVFPKIWDERKDELKELSKKELAKEMFSQGIRSTLEVMQDIDGLEDDENEAG